MDLAGGLGRRLHAKPAAAAACQPDPGHPRAVPALPASRFRRAAGELPNRGGAGANSRRKG